MNRQMWGLLSLSLMACVPEEPVASPDLAELERGCPAPEPEDISVLLAGVPDGTHWDELDPAVQEALEEHAEILFEQHRDEWDSHGLRSKERKVLYDRGAIRDNIEEYVVNQFGDLVEDPFSIDALDRDLGRQLRKLYLAHIATSRKFLLGKVTYDWDGVSPLVGQTFPDPETLEDQQDYADDVADELEDLVDDCDLDEDEAALAAAALDVARSLRTGSIAFLSYGGDDLQVPASLANIAPTVAYDYGLNGFIPTAEEYLRYQNAYWMGESYHLSAHTIAAATHFVGPAAATRLSFYQALFPTEPETARQAHMLATLWTDRLLAHPDAALQCNPYTEDERERIIDSFTADLQVPYQEDFFETFESRLDTDALLLTSEYQDSALASLALFDDVALPPDQRAAVEAAILAEPRFGALTTTVKNTLTAVTGAPDAAAAYTAALASVPLVGGYTATGTTTVNPAHKAVVDNVWANVRAGLIARHSSGDRPFELDTYLPQTVTVDTQVSSRTFNGEIFIGLGPLINEAQLYLTLTHEALHALDHRANLAPTGSAIEGAATLTAHPLAREILAEFAPPDRAAFYNLITTASDARRYGVSDASVAVLQTECPDDLSSATLATDVAAAWGASSSDLLTTSARAHWGTQFLSYLAGQSEYAKLVDYFEAQIQPDVDNHIDPFDLHSCGLLTPALTPEVAAELQSCMGL